MTWEAYRDIAPSGIVDLGHRISERLKGKTLLHVNSTRWGGGVAEMLHRLVPLFQDLGVDTQWDVIEGSPEFYQVTKAFHNALQGQAQVITSEMYDAYLKINKKNGRKMDLNADMVIIHDPQPAPLIYKKKKQSKWLWRCHIDASRPQRNVWNFLKSYVSKYDGAILSLPGFARKLNIPQYLVYPSIDPLSDKNKELTEDEVRGVLRKYNIPEDKPMILQVSRFDRFKDPVGVIESYKMVKKYNDCCLVLAGGGAADDPEGAQVLIDVENAAEKDKDIFILDLPPDANIEINALQRAATVVIQKSLKEGFGLTVAEAMWKGKPVIGGDTGGIRLQIIDSHTGYLVSTPEGAALRIRFLLHRRKRLEEMGARARDYVRDNFLLTRHLREYLTVMISVANRAEERIELE
ncbi:MAG: glycosyltransferase [Candidatus Omnitrophica bacterium]|nr:glycosyltransferase [Candidatus Omnitrophota bacterium]